MVKKFELSTEDRDTLTLMVSSKELQAPFQFKAKALLLRDKGTSNKATAADTGISTSAITTLINRFIDHLREIRIYN